MSRIIFNFYHLFIIASFVLFLTSSLEAKVYKWVDEKGKTHFTDDKSKIPPAKKKSIPSSESDSASSKEDLLAGKPTTARFSSCPEVLTLSKQIVHRSYLKKTYDCPKNKVIRANKGWKCQPSDKQVPYCKWITCSRDYQCIAETRKYNQIKILKIIREDEAKQKDQMDDMMVEAMGGLFLGKKFSKNKKIKDVDTCGKLAQHMADCSDYSCKINNPAMKQIMTYRFIKPGNKGTCNYYFKSASSKFLYSIYKCTFSASQVELRNKFVDQQIRTDKAKSIKGTSRAGDKYGYLELDGGKREKDYFTWAESEGICKSISGSSAIPLNR